MRRKKFDKKPREEVGVNLVTNLVTWVKVKGSRMARSCDTLRKEND